MKGIELAGIMIWTAIVVVGLFTRVRDYIISCPLFILIEAKRDDIGIFGESILLILGLAILLIIFVLLAFIFIWVGNVLIAVLFSVTGIRWLPMP